MARTERLFDLLQALRRRRSPASGAELAAALGVSLRTLYRDIAALQALGAEIDGEPGVGYVLRPGFLLPPLMFSEEEIEALALGAKWVAQRTDETLSKAAGDAMAKIAAVLPRDLRARLDESALLIGPGWTRPQTVALSTLRAAIRDERRLRIAYRNAKGEASERVVWPFLLAFFETKRVLAAWCEMRRGFRHFRADRIESASPLEDRFPRRRRALLKEWRETMLTEYDSALRNNPDIRLNGEEPAMPKELVFYTNPQSRGAIVHWMLEEIGAPYRIEIKEYGTTMKAPDYLALNPMGKVPAIRHGDTVVTETAAICAYLADAFPEARLAPAPADRGEYYRWLFFAAGPMEAAVANHSAGWDPAPDKQPLFGYGSYEAVMDTLSGWLRGRTYVAGDRFTAADVYVGSHIGWGLQFGTVPRLPEFREYWRGLRDRPAHRRAEEKGQQLAAKDAWAEA